MPRQGTGRIKQREPLDRLSGVHGGDGSLRPGLCKVVGLNENYVSGSGTPYHLQVEDHGPVVDKLTRHHVRRVNVVVYANYGEPNSRIIHGCDHDYPDIRTHEHNAFIAREVLEQAAAAKSLIEERERRKIERLKRQIRQYYLSRSEPIKREFEETNALYPFVFSRAWQELRQERARPAGTAPAAGLFSGARYRADDDLREHVLEIERIIISIGQDMARLRAARGADEALLRTCGETVAQARATLAGRDKAEFNPRRLVLIRNTLLTTWRRVHTRLES